MLKFLKYNSLCLSYDVLILYSFSKLKIFTIGDIENGIEHLSTALAVCGEPQHLIEVLQVQLPPPIFHMLMQRLPIVSQVGYNSINLMFGYQLFW